MDDNIPEVCQFCEQSIEIKSKCVNCDLFLCRLCNMKIHAKIKSAEEHISIDIQDLENDSAIEAIRKVDLDTMKCSLHDNKRCIMYCENCEHIICSTCIINHHEKHILHELSEAYKDKLFKMKTFRGEIQQNIKFMNKEEDKLKKLQSRVSNHKRIIQTSIMNQDTKIKDTLSQKTAKLLYELQEEWIPTKIALSSNIKAIQETKDDLIERKETLDKAFQSQLASDVFHVSNSILKQMPPKNVSQVQYKPFQLIEKDLDFDELNDNLHKIPNIEIVVSYKSDIDIVTKIVSRGDNTICVCNELAGKLIQYRLENDGSEVQKEIDNVCISDMSVSIDGNILMSVGDDIKVLTKNGKDNVCISDMSVSIDGNILMSVGDDIKVLTKNGNIKTFATVDFGPLDLDCYILCLDLHIICVHINDKNEIFVGAFVVHKQTRSESGIVLVLDQYGRVIDTYHRDCCKSSANENCSDDGNNDDHEYSDDESNDYGNEISFDDGNSDGYKYRGDYSDYYGNKTSFHDGNIDGHEYRSDNSDYVGEYECKYGDGNENENGYDRKVEYEYDKSDEMQDVFANENSDSNNEYGKENTEVQWCGNSWEYECENDNEYENSDNCSYENPNLFTLPSRVISTREDNLLIIDTFSFECSPGRLVLLNRDGEVKWRYSGCNCKECVNLFPAFCSIDIAESLSGVILVTDIGCYTKLHVLNGNGQTLTCNFVGHLGISNPISLYVEGNGMLWIGCKSKDINDANIYCLKFQNTKIESSIKD